jgi:hypothetical protein
VAHVRADPARGRGGGAAQARASGIDFLEVARYNDESGTAPIPTGYSEVVFGEVFAASGWPRDEVTIASKLWWEFWPQTPAQELEASLERTGLERFDFVYSDPPPPDLPMAEIVASVAQLVADGRVRAWGIVNWPAERIAEAGRVAQELGVAPPCAAQLPYSLIARDWVEGPEMTEALLACGAKVVASYVLAGGILSGKYASGAGGRMARGDRRPGVGGRPAGGARARGARGRGGHDTGRAGHGLRAHQLAGGGDPLRRHRAGADPRERCGRRAGRDPHGEPARAPAGHWRVISLPAVVRGRGAVVSVLGVRRASTRR